MSETKRCPRCGVTKPRAEFSPRNAYCRPCASERMKQRYWANAEYREQRKAYHKQHERNKRADPEKNAVILERLREKRATNHEWRAKQLASVNARRRHLVGRDLAIAAKKRAKGRGMACTITPEWTQAMWERDPHCVYCRRELRVGDGTHAHHSPTLDRIDTSKGYVTENVALSCFRCNTLKRDATLAELETLVANIKRVVA